MTDFRSLHVPGDPLVLVNAWDAASARIVEAAGAAAIATTSAGLAWSLGAQDGNAVDRDLAVAAVARIAAVVSVPVSADVETGHGDVAATVRGVRAAGVVGINLEDGADDVATQVARIGAARAADADLFINARIDTFLRGLGGLDETVERAAAYLAAGADGIFVPGVADPEIIAALVERISAPVNIMVGPGAPVVSELAKLGVARVSLGSAVAEAAYGLVRRAAEAALGTGDYGPLDGSAGYGELNALFG
jgi:2-methylisocitrate lyase-like PEP mutase family enzyme